jgi:hypothetical protein
MQIQEAQKFLKNHDYVSFLSIQEEKLERFKNNNFYQAVKILPEVLIKHTIMLYNKDNYIYFDLDTQFNLTYVKKFIENRKNFYGVS